MDFHGGLPQAPLPRPGAILAGTFRLRGGSIARLRPRRGFVGQAVGGAR